MGSVGCCPIVNSPLFLKGVECPAGCIPAPEPTPIPTPTPPGRERIGHAEYGIGAPAYNLPSLLKLLRSLPNPVPIATIVDYTFGNVDGPLTQVFDTGKVNRFEAHLLNGTCVSNRVCWRGDLLYGYTWPKIEQEAKTVGSRFNQILCNQAARIKTYATKYPGIQFYISGVLEHRLTQSGAQAVVNTLANCAPGFVLSDSPAGSPLYSSLIGALPERHGTAVGAICDLDGTEIADIDVEKWKNDCGNAELVFAWGRCKNGRTNNTSWVQPNLRKAFCTEDQTFWYEALRRPAEPMPTAPTPFCRHVAPVTSPAIWKTSAEDKGIPDIRKNKPLIISKSKGDWTVIAVGGAVIGRLKYYGTYGDLSWRLYRAYSGTGSGQSALQYSKDAKAVGGSEWMYLRNSVGDCFLVNSLRRSGVFHP